MKRYLLMWLVILTLANTCLALSVSDNFTRANASPISGGNWSVPSSATGLQIVSNNLGVIGVNQVNMEYYSAVTWPNDQSSQVTFVSGSGTTAAGPTVRQQAAGANNYNGVEQTGAGNYVIEKMASGSNTILLTISQSPVNGDVIKLTVTGTTLQLLINGICVSTCTVTDSTYSSGNAGIFMYGPGSSNPKVGTWVGTASSGGSGGQVGGFLVGP